jgi:outer membrane lipoprotein SlyB
MHRLAPLAMVALLGMVPVAPAMAEPVRYEHNGKYYKTRAECQAAKKRAEKRGTIVGAAVAGVGAALLGGNVGETALVAGGGAVVGNALGSKSKKC